MVKKRDQVGQPLKIFINTRFEILNVVLLAW